MSHERIHNTAEIIPSQELISPVPVIAIVGQAGVGKGVVCEILQKRFNFECYTVSTIIKELMSAEKRDTFSRENARQIHAETIEIYGKSAFIRTILKRGIRHNNIHPIGGIAVDGPRHDFEVEAVKKQPKGIAIGIVADEYVRFERLKNRKRTGDPKTRSEFNKLQRAEGPIIEKALKHADKVFLNEINLKDLESQIVRYLQPKLNSLYH